MSIDEHQTDPLDGLAETLDHAAAAMVAQATHGLSPATLVQAWSDWALHLAISPGRQLQLATKLGRKYMRLADYAARRAGDPDTLPAIEPLPQDRRFDDPAWREQPYDLLVQAFLLTQQWWHAATTGIKGVDRHHEDMVAFAARQILDIVAPTNIIAANPVLQKRIVETGGRCLIDGIDHLFEDMGRL